MYQRSVTHMPIDTSSFLLQRIHERPPPKFVAPGWFPRDEQDGGNMQDGTGEMPQARPRRMMKDRTAWGNFEVSNLFS